MLIGLKMLFILKFTGIKIVYLESCHGDISFCFHSAHKTIQKILVRYTFIHVCTKKHDASFAQSMGCFFTCFLYGITPVRM